METGKGCHALRSTVLAREKKTLEELMLHMIVRPAELLQNKYLHLHLSI